MAELSQTDIETKLTAIDAQIATLTGTLVGGTGAAQYTDYRVGQLEVKGSQQMEQLLKAREYYQGLLEKIPTATADVVSNDVDITGRDHSDMLGDE